MSMNVSIVIPVYNMASYIEDVLEALVRQSFPMATAEILLINDGSTDETVARAENARERLSLTQLRIITQANTGPAAARNNGIARASAPIVAFLDSDCIPEPQWLEALLAPLLEDATLAGAEGKTVPAGPSDSPFDHYIDNPTGGNYQTCNIAYRRQWLLEAGGLDENMRWCEDLDLAHRMKRFGAIGFSPQAVVRHLVIRWPFLKHLKVVRTFPYMITLWKKNPGAVLPAGSGFAQLLIFQLKSTLKIPINHRRWMFKRPLEYGLLVLMVIAWLIDTTLMLPYYYLLSKRPVISKQPLKPGVAVP